jgi:hypothetical protein
MSICPAIDDLPFLFVKKSHGTKPYTSNGCPTGQDKYVIATATLWETEGVWIY